MTLWEQRQMPEVQLIKIVLVEKQFLTGVKFWQYHSENDILKYDRTCCEVFPGAARYNGYMMACKYPQTSWITDLIWCNDFAEFMVVQLFYIHISFRCCFQMKCVLQFDTCMTPLLLLGRYVGCKISPRFCCAARGESGGKGRKLCALLIYGIALLRTPREGVSISCQIGCDVPGYRSATSCGIRLSMSEFSFVQ